MGSPDNLYRLRNLPHTEVVEKNPPKITERCDDIARESRNGVSVRLQSSAQQEMEAFAADNSREEEKAVTHNID